jgi:predicted AlkP superfamily pyrophosphatase or phosphodiesterase
VNSCLFSRKILKGEASSIISLARIPTVTKPCLKSIFSGSLPVFFELVENIDESGVSASVQTIQDNLLTRLHSQGKKISLYGDDVWTKLFPLSMFHRHNVDYGLNIMVKKVSIIFECLFYF